MCPDSHLALAPDFSHFTSSLVSRDCTACDDVPRFAPSPLTRLFAFHYHAPTLALALLVTQTPSLSGALHFRILGLPAP